MVVLLEGGDPFEEVDSKRSARVWCRIAVIAERLPLLRVSRVWTRTCLPADLIRCDTSESDVASSA